MSLFTINEVIFNINYINIIVIKIVKIINKHQRGLMS